MRGYQQAPVASAVDTALEAFAFKGRGVHLGDGGALQGAAGPREVDLQIDDSAARILAAAGSESCAGGQMCAPRQLLLAQGQRALHEAAAAAAVCGYGLPHTIGLESRPWTAPRLLPDEVVCHPGA